MESDISLLLTFGSTGKALASAAFFALDVRERDIDYMCWTAVHALNTEPDAHTAHAKRQAWL